MSLQKGSLIGEKLPNLATLPYITHFTRLERLDRDKRFSFYQTFVNYGFEKFYNVGPRREFEHLIELPCLEDLVSRLEPFLNSKTFWVPLWLGIRL
jgi:hypothetical protein